MQIEELDKKTLEEKERVRLQTKANIQARAEARRKAEEKEILALIGQNYSVKQIAVSKGENEFATRRKIKRIDSALLEEAYRIAKEKQDKEILDLLKKGYSRASIGVELDVSPGTIRNRIQQIDKAKLEEALKEGEKAKEAIKQQEQLEKQKKVEQEKIKMGKSAKKNEVEKKLCSKKLTKKDVADYRKAIDEKYDTVTEKEIILLVKAYVKFNQIREAEYFLNAIINNEDMQYLNIEGLKQIRTEVQEIKKKQIAWKLVRQKMKTEDIMEMSGLRETDVIALKRKWKMKQEGVGQILKEHNPKGKLGQPPISQGQEFGE